MKTIPQELEAVRAAAQRVLAPIKPTDDQTKADPKFLFSAQRTNAGRNLPAYYLVYFLLVDLLDFKNLGKFEKIAWSVPIDFRGKAFLIEHRKFGVGVFAHDAVGEEKEAVEIVALIKKGVKIAEPFFDWLANSALIDSKLNIKNNSAELFNRFEFFRKAHKEAIRQFKLAEKRTGKKGLSQRATAKRYLKSLPLKDAVQWQALAAIDAFFSWTEHVFIHLAVISGNVTSGEALAKLVESDWQTKYKKALDISDQGTKRFFDELVVIRRQLRNFIAHGAFGKSGEAFTFHSGAGAVPLVLPHKMSNSRFKIGEQLTFEDSAALKIISEFIAHLWAGARTPAKIYIQRSGLPIILTMASDGTFEQAMNSPKKMQALVKRLNWEWDRAGNMDW